MRDYFESLENQHLAPYAVKSSASRGHLYDEAVSETRTCFQRDRDRVIHSKAFRRLKHKTQVFVASESDHYRSRLTHTLEVAQVSRHLARLLKLNEDLCEVIALAHDLGHTPFGHSGERELNRMMADVGGFEHNLQSLRIVEFLERKYPHFPGLNLSFEVREGLMKHKSYIEAEDRPKFRFLEAQLVNLADEIAYNNHDIDDGLRSGIVIEDDLASQVTIYKETQESVARDYTNLNQNERWHLINSRLISTFIMDVYHHTLEVIQSHELKSVDDIQMIDRPIVRYSDELSEKNKELRTYLYQNFYQHSTVYRMNKRGQMVVVRLFQAFLDDLKLLPADYQAMIGDESKERVIADYIAGMTDLYALKEHDSIFK